MSVRRVSFADAGTLDPTGIARLSGEQRSRYSRLTHDVLWAETVASQARGAGQPDADHLSRVAAACRDRLETFVDTVRRRQGALR